MRTLDWIPTKQSLPNNNVLVHTKIHDAKGVRNETKLKRNNKLWFVADGSMYVYYTPTHWAAINT